MIKAVLLDLDDTLIISQTAAMFPEYLRVLGVSGQEFLPPAQFSQHVYSSYVAALSEYDPAQTLINRFFAKFADSLESNQATLRAFFNQFYTTDYPAIVTQFVTSQPEAVTLVRWLRQQGYKLVVATNPAMPETTVVQRLAAGGLSPTDFDLVTALENMHFGKPQPEYYEEILVRLDIEAGEAIMVGDDWDNDIGPALAAGLSTYWLTSGAEPKPEHTVRVDGNGSFSQFAARARAGWLATLRPHYPGYQALIHRLAAFPAGVAATIEGHLQAVLECKPADFEWCARDIICHLRDHDAEEDHTRLERILSEEAPFLSGNYDPWAHAQDYLTTSANAALVDFVHYRGRMVQWLRSQPAEVWKRPARHAIFGPTSFEEMVRFATEHDRTHLRQMRSAIANAVVVCGPTSTVASD
jgi:HAD superfamily hydrolase (TIGR01549 family)